MSKSEVLFLWLALALALESSALLAFDPDADLCEGSAARVSGKPWSRHELVEKFLGMTHVDAGENTLFKHRKDLSLRQLRQQGIKRRLAFFVENALLKRLKDKVFHDTEAAVAVTSLYKSIFMRNLRNAVLPNGTPVMDLIEAPYSDYKSLRFLFADNTPELRAALEKVYEQTSHEFERHLELYPDLMGLAKEAGRGENDLLSDPKKWHLAGFGETAGLEVAEAAAAAKEARYRNNPGDKTIGVQRFSDATVQRVLRERFAMAENARAALEEQFKDHPQIMTKHGDVYVFSRGLMEVLKDAKGKSFDGHEAYLDYVRSEIWRTLEVDVSWTKLQEETGTDPITRMQRLFNAYDAFAPSIYQDLEIVDMGISRAQHGLMAVDHTGQGIRNMEEFARRMALLAKKGAGPGEDIVQRALKQGELGQVKASGDFDVIQGHVFRGLEELGQKGDPHFSDDGKPELSGDDLIHAPDHEMTDREKFEMQHYVATHATGSTYRFAWVPASYKPAPGSKEAKPISAAERAAMIDMGHGLEKDLRRALFGKIARSDLEKISIGFDLVPNDGGGGSVRLIIGGTHIGNSSIKKIEAQAAFMIRDFRQHPEFEGYTLEPTLSRYSYAPANPEMLYHFISPSVPTPEGPVPRAGVTGAAGGASPALAPRSPDASPPGL